LKCCNWPIKIFKNNKAKLLVIYKKEFLKIKELSKSWSIKIIKTPQIFKKMD
jgi:hypothetical protein